MGTQMCLTSHARSKSGPINLLNSHRAQSPTRQMNQPLEQIFSPQQAGNRPVSSQKLYYTTPPVHSDVVRINVRKTRKVSTRSLFSESTPVSLKKPTTGEPFRTAGIQRSDFLFGAEVHDGFPLINGRSVKRYKLTRKSVSSRNIILSQLDTGKPIIEEKPILLAPKQPSFPSLIPQENKSEEKSEVIRLSRRPSTHLSALFTEGPVVREKQTEPQHHLQIVTNQRKPTKKMTQKSAFLKRLNLTKEL